MNYKLR